MGGAGQQKPPDLPVFGGTERERTMPGLGQSLIPYGEMVERAMRGVVREALARVAADGLPGGHHFYLSFRTAADGVAVPGHLRASHPDETTIVLQHRFWGLEIAEDSFSVTLAFGGRHERLTIPFAALTAFVDPSVEFGLQFGRSDAANDAPEAAAPEEAPESEPRPATVVALDAFRKS